MEPLRKTTASGLRRLAVWADGAADRLCPLADVLVAPQGAAGPPAHWLDLFSGSGAPPLWVGSSPLPAVSPADPAVVVPRPAAASRPGPVRPAHRSGPARAAEREPAFDWRAASAALRSGDDDPRPRPVDHAVRVLPVDGGRDSRGAAVRMSPGDGRPDSRTVVRVAERRAAAAPTPSGHRDEPNAGASTAGRPDRADAMPVRLERPSAAHTVNRPAGVPEVQAPPVDRRPADAAPAMPGTRGATTAMPDRVHDAQPTRVGRDSARHGETPSPAGRSRGLGRIFRSRPAVSDASALDSAGPVVSPAAPAVERRASTHSRGATPAQADPTTRAADPTRTEIPVAVAPTSRRAQPPPPALRLVTDRPARTVHGTSAPDPRDRAATTHRPPTVDVPATAPAAMWPDLPEPLPSISAVEDFDAPRLARLAAEQEDRPWNA